jgi:serine/threonine-protein kinase
MTIDEEEKSLFFNTGDELSQTVSHFQSPVPSQSHHLVNRYDEIVEGKRHSWTTHLRLLQKLGEGGQGVVYLTERRGADKFTLPVALKVFSPERYPTIKDYEDDMFRMAAVASKVARIQHEKLLQVENFLDHEQIRMMVMEWVEGYDLRRLLTPKMFGIVKQRVSEKRWDHINDVLVTSGPVQPRFKAGAAVAIVRDCLEALAAMHRIGIVHGDVKPGNVMLKRSGHAKLIDMGAAFEIDKPAARRTCTPVYAAIEVLEGKQNTPQSDLASLGYVTLELLAGRPLFPDARGLGSLLKAKHALINELHLVLPEEVYCNDLLVSFCRGLINPKMNERFHSAEAADFLEEGAAAFHRQLIKNDLASQYENDIRIWVEELIEISSGDYRSDGDDQIG